MTSGIAVAAAIALSASVVAAGAMYDARPPLAHTGGFGEPTCRECHFDGPPEAPDVLSLGGVPERYAPGSVYRLEVIISDTLASLGGFQLAVRVAEGPNAGTQAGTLQAADTRVDVSVDTASGVQYASHALAAPYDSMRWVVEWRAPARDVGPVLVSAAANAANDDDSPFGDRILVGSWRVEADSADSRRSP